MSDYLVGISRFGLVGALLGCPHGAIFEPLLSLRGPSLAVRGALWAVWGSPRAGWSLYWGRHGAILDGLEPVSGSS
eukprot:108820-Pyramimonas_sp.AAC.1